MISRMTAALAIGALWGAGILSAAGDAAKGKAIFAKSCRSCHGAEGQGNPAIAKALKTTIRNLGSKEVQAKSDAELRKDMLGGTAKKKPVKGVTEADTEDVVAFVRTLAK